MASNETLIIPLLSLSVVLLTFPPSALKSNENRLSPSYVEFVFVVKLYKLVRFKTTVVLFPAPITVELALNVANNALSKITLLLTLAFLLKVSAVFPHQL